MSSKSWVGGGDPLAGGGVGDFSSVCAGVSIVWGWFGVGGGVGSGNSIPVGGGGERCSKSNPQSSPITGYLSFTFLFFLSPGADGWVVLVVFVCPVRMVSWSPPLFLAGDNTRPLSRFIPSLIS